MARALRISYPEAYYHVSCRGNEQKAIFRDDKDRHAFLDRLQGSLKSYGALLHAYVLMENHFHLILQTPLGNLSELMRHFNIAYTSYFNRRHERVGHLYQGRFKAIVIEADAYLVELSRYVHLNPIRVMKWESASLKERSGHLTSYRWSSLPGYLSKTHRQEFVEYGMVLGYVGGEKEEGRRAYAKIIEEGIRHGVERPWDRLTGQVVLGSEAFVAKLRKQIDKGEEQAREQPSMRALSKRWSPDELIERVGKILGCKREALCTRGGGWERAILMECLHRYAQESQVTIGRRMGGVDYSWVSRMRKELRLAVQKDKKVRILFRKVERYLLAQE